MPLTCVPGNWTPRTDIDSVVAEPSRQMTKTQTTRTLMLKCTAISVSVLRSLSGAQEPSRCEIGADIWRWFRNLSQAASDATVQCEAVNVNEWYADADFSTSHTTQYPGISHRSLASLQRLGTGALPDCGQ